MLMPQKNRRAIFEYLFKEGVCVAKQDYNQKTHPDIPGVTNLEVIKACKVSFLLYGIHLCVMNLAQLIIGRKQR